MSEHKVNIVKIKELVKHPNADTLSIATMEGNTWQCVVKTGQFLEGQLGIYIPIDSIVPQKVIEDYYLDYLKKGARVTTIKLRGVVSQGLLLNLPAGSIWREGQDVARELNIVKYVPPEEITQVRNMRHQKKILLNDNFDKYTDIQNIKNHPKVFNNGEMVGVSEKLHGCFQFNTRVTLSNGTYMKIGDIVDQGLDVELLGVDENGSIVPSKIINRFNNGKTKSWVYVKVVTNHGFRRIICTPEHKIFSPDANGYKEASTLVVGEKVLAHAKDLYPNYVQRQVLLGLMLGDGSLGVNKSVCFSHKESNLEYFNYIMECLGSLAGNRQANHISGYGTTMLRGRTISSDFIQDLFLSWYAGKGKSKQVVEETIEKCCGLTPISLAFWYMDDGSLSHSEFQEDRASIASCRFTKESHDILIRYLNRMDLFPILYSTENKGAENKYLRLRFNTTAAYKMFTLIAPYIPPCMQYKLPEEFRGLYVANLNTLVRASNREFNLHSVLEVREYSSPVKVNSNRYDLETETHNYFADGILVHNCNGRAGYLKKTPKTAWAKLAAWFRPYEYVYGSHNVQHNPSDPNHKSSVWEIVLDRYELKRILCTPENRGVEMFFEVFGPRVQDLTYGLAVVDCAFFDMKRNGKYVDYYDFRDFCFRNHLPTVPELYIGPYSEDVVKKYTTGNSPQAEKMGVKQIREGIVIKSLEEQEVPYFGRKILKSISVDYLLRKHGTEKK